MRNAKRENKVLEREAMSREDLTQREGNKAGGEWWRDALADGRERIGSRFFS